MQATMIQACWKLFEREYKVIKIEERLYNTQTFKNYVIFCCSVLILDESVVSDQVQVNSRLSSSRSKCISPVRFPAISVISDSK